MIDGDESVRFNTTHDRDRVSTYQSWVPRLTLCLFDATKQCHMRTVREALDRFQPFPQPFASS
jgi:hypothetical protein